MRDCRSHGQRRRCVRDSCRNGLVYVSFGDGSSSMTIATECQECGKQHRVPDDKAGRKFRCRACEAVVHIPDEYEAPIRPRRKPASKKRRDGGEGKKSRSKKSKSSANTGLIVGMATGGVVLVAGIAVGYFMLTGDSEELPPVAGRPEPATASQGGAPDTKTETVVDTVATIQTANSDIPTAADQTAVSPSNTDVTPDATDDEAAITELLTQFYEATDLPDRLRCVVDPPAVRTYMMQVYGDYFLKLAKGVVDPLRVKSVTIANRTRDGIVVTASFHSGTDFEYRVVSTADGYRIDWMYGRREHLLVSNIIDSGIKQRAWHVILPADAIDYRLRDSKKTDFLKGTTTTLGSTLPANYKDSECENVYYSTIRTTPNGLSESEVVVDIEVTVFKTEDFAQREMAIIRESAFGDPSSSFYCKEIPIPALGDERLCKQWKTFAPDVVFRKQHAVIRVSCRTVFPLANRTSNSSTNLTESIRVAVLQADVKEENIGPQN
jgi:hypothetical protein